MDPKVAQIAQRLSLLLSNRPAEAGIHAAASRAEPSVGSQLASLATAPSAGGGSRLVGEAHALKGLGSLREKRERQGADVEIRDGLRYTIVLAGMNFTNRVIHIADSLRGSGYRCTRMNTTEGKRGWERGYIGVNSNWSTSEGTIFELQFHTELSWHAKSASHGAYEVWREDSSNPIKRAANTSKFQECFNSGATSLGVEAWKLDGVGSDLDKWFASQGRP
ncbi:MAG: hypothetical protein ACI841_000603 [Planctomycetota bacterium]|jgi:hypothetical protein